MRFSNFFGSKRQVIITLVFLSCFLCVFSQDIPKGYRAVQLGMSLEEVKNALASDSIFAYRGERDVSLLPSTEEYIIETEGSSFLSRCWFQFHNNNLYIITITMNEQSIDYYSVFKTLFDKYGQPQSLSPEFVVWEDAKVRMSLERPLTLKYLDSEVYNSLLRSSQVDQSAVEMSRQKFLESF